MNTQLIQAIEKAKHTQASLARELGVTAQVVHNWVKRGVPPERAPELEKILGVSKQKLCPDFPW